MKTTGVIIARFQTPYLHQGHISLINYVKERHNKVVIVLGVSPVKGSTRNPLDFYTRERMVKHTFPDIIILPLSDCRNDNTWSNNLDHMLSITFQNEKFLLYGSRDSFIPYYKGKLDVMEIPQTTEENGTNLRDKISDQVMQTEDFRRGIIYAYYNKYPTVYPTLDIALFKDDYNYLLLGFRNEEGKWRLPGGFSDPTDDDYESAALRELHEECGMIEIDKMSYEKSFKVNDWRYRSETDKIITLMFSCSYLFGEVKAGDDIDIVQWFSLEDIIQMLENKKIAEEHYPQIIFLINKYSECKTKTLQL
ncbi:MAG: NUDIX domain-containing protein [Cytophagaceae bacterium]